MKVKALRSFQSSKGYGFIRAGTTFNCEPGYAKDLLMRSPKMIEEVKDLEPERNQMLPGPSKSKEEQGKDPTTSPAPASQNVSAARVIDGAVAHAPSSRAGRRSVKLT